MLTMTDEFTGEAIGGAQVYPELAGKRVLITGITGRFGVDIARAFAEHNARLILQIEEASPETDTLAEVLSPLAQDMTVRSGPLATTDDVVHYARAMAQTYGGLDVVINLVAIERGAAQDTDGSSTAIETEACELLTRPCLVARIAANRMRLTHTEGLIITIAALPGGASERYRAFAMIVKSAIAAMTRAEAGEWAGDAIRFNAIAPAVGGVDAEPGLSGETGIAALALFLATSRGKALSGHVFEASIASAD